MMIKAKDLCGGHVISIMNRNGNFEKQVVLIVEKETKNDDIAVCLESGYVLHFTPEHQIMIS